MLVRRVLVSCAQLLSMVRVCLYGAPLDKTTEGSLRAPTVVRPCTQPLYGQLRRASAFGVDAQYTRPSRKALESLTRVYFYGTAGNGAGGHPGRARDLLLPTNGREYETHRGGRWQEALQVRLRRKRTADYYCCYFVIQTGLVLKSVCNMRRMQLSYKQ